MKSWRRVTNLSFSLLLLLTLLFKKSESIKKPKLTSDPRVITYPGDINFALIVDGHQNYLRTTRGKNISTPGLECSSHVNSDGVLKGMGAIWATHQINIRKGNPNQLKIGVSVYDSCGSSQVMQRQVVRLLASSSSFSSSSRESKKECNSGLTASASTTSTTSTSTGSSSSAAASTKITPILFGVVMDTEDGGYDGIDFGGGTSSSSSSREYSGSSSSSSVTNSDGTNLESVALSLLNSFAVPVVTTSDIRPTLMSGLTSGQIVTSGGSGSSFMNGFASRNGQRGPTYSSVFTVAPSLTYMSKGVMSLLKRLNWSSATLVISDEVPAHYASIFEESAKRVSFNIIPANSNTRKIFKRSSLYYQPSSILPESYKNTLLFLSPRESVQLFTSLRSHHPLPANDKYNWIIITDSDISDRIKGILSNYTLHASGNKGCNTKSMFLLVPNTNLPTKEFNKYFEHEVSNFGSNSVHPLISSFSKQFLSDDDENDGDGSGSSDGDEPKADASDSDGVNRNKTSSSSSSGRNVKQKKLIIHSSEGLSTTIKAVWAMAMSLRNAEREYCNPFMSRIDCLDTLKLMGLKNIINNQTRNLNEKIDSSGIQSLDGFNLKFDPQNILTSNKYTLKIVTSSCKVLDAGYFSDETGLIVDEDIMSSLKIDSSTFNTVTQVRPGAYYTFRNGTNVPKEILASTTYRTGDTPSAESKEDRLSTNAGRTYSRSLSSESTEDTSTSGESLVTRDPGVEYSTPETSSSVSRTHPKNFLSSNDMRPVNLLKRNFQMTSPSPVVPSADPNVTSASTSGTSTSGTAGSGTIAHVSHFSRSGNKIDLSKPKNASSSSSSSSTSTPSDHRQQRSGDIGSSSIRRKNQIKNMFHNHPHNGHSSSSSLTSWLGRPWALTIIISAIIGALLTLYTFTFLLMKSCEGALGRSNRQAISSLHLFAIVSLFIGSLLYVFEPTPFSCTLRSSIHNLTLALLFGTLLLRAMYLRAQKWIGLGGQISSANQFVTLSFIIGVQVALEAQTWKYLSPWSNIVTANLPAFCRPDSSEFIYSQIYLILVFSLLLIFSWISRHQPFTSNEGSHLFTATALMAPIYVTSLILSIHYLEEEKFTYSSSKPSITNLSIDTMSASTMSSSMMSSGLSSSSSSSVLSYLNEERSNASTRDVISAMCMILSGFVTLISIFVPILYAIHKHGDLMPSKSGAAAAAAASYADSLSTAFTMFRNNQNPTQAGYSSSVAAALSSGLAGANAANYHFGSHHPVVPHGITTSGHVDHRPILGATDSISSSGSTESRSSESANNTANSSSSFLNASPVLNGVRGMHHTSSGNHETSAKGLASKKNKISKISKKRRTNGSKSIFSVTSPLTKSKTSSGGQLIFSPATNSYSYSCTSPNCNFKLATRPLGHQSSQLSPSSSAHQLMTPGSRLSASHLPYGVGSSSGNLVHNHPNGPMASSQTTPYTSRQASYAMGPSANPHNNPHISNSNNSSGHHHHLSPSSHITSNRGSHQFAFPSSGIKRLIDDRSVGSTARVNPLFETTAHVEGSHQAPSAYRSAYP